MNFASEASNLAEGLISGIVVALAAVGTGFFFNRVGKSAKARASKFINVAELTDTSFRTSFLSIAFNASFGFLGIIGEIILLIFRPNGWELLCFFSSLPIIIGGLGVYCDLKRQVNFVSTKLTYKGMGGGFQIDLNDIKLVYVFRGLAAIELRTGEKRCIPLLFKDSGKLLAMLRYYRPKPS